MEFVEFHFEGFFGLDLFDGPALVVGVGLV